MDCVRLENAMIIDAHQHFWDVSRFQYPWMTPDREKLRRSFLPDDLRPLLARAGVMRTVVVQAHQSLQESRWLLDLASANDFIAGVVAWTDLTSPTLADDLDELMRHPKFKGVRHPIEDESDDAWMIRPQVLKGLGELERRGIPYDLLVWPRHLEYIPRLRDCCPTLKLVVDHIAKPPIALGKVDSWARALETVAGLQNIWCKLSGMITLTDWQRWTPNDLKPYIDQVIKLFGYDRVMFGSDWPVCTLAGSYGDVVEALRYALAETPEQEAAKVWGKNACFFYHLE
jgi:L-fuconolactonase